MKPDGFCRNRPHDFLQDPLASGLLEPDALSLLGRGSFERLEAFEPLRCFQLTCELKEAPVLSETAVAESS